MSTVWQQEDNGNRYIAYGVLFSLLIHIILAFVALQRTALPTLREEALEVSFVTLPELLQPTSQNKPPPRQIVTQPESPQVPTTQANESARFLSEKDFTTEKEQIKRGDAPNAGPQPGKNNSASAPSNPSRAAKPSNPSQQKPTGTKSESAPAHSEKSTKAPSELKELLLDDATLLEKFSAPKPQRSRSLLDPTTSSQTAAAAPQPFSRPAGSGAAFIGMQGSNDYLPNLPDGDITLLNTKADKYAVFVRRVATQVFAQIRLTGWEALRAGDIHQINDYSVVHAVLNPKGELIKATIESSSGSSRFDALLLEATRNGARDPNPPASAQADDGNYHFIFKSKSWSQVSSSARTGAPYERRWLLLATGLL